jgi:hypothetical protein
MIVVRYKPINLSFSLKAFLCMKALHPRTVSGLKRKYRSLAHSVKIISFYRNLPLLSSFIKAIGLIPTKRRRFNENE